MALTSISFVKDGGKYRGRFTASGPFAVEVKGVNGYIGVGINYSGTNEEYCMVNGSYERGEKLYVKNFGNGTEAYPVYVEVVCDSNPTSGGYIISE